MSKLNLIIQREFIAKVRNKSFIVMTFLSPLIMIGMGALIFFLTKKNNAKIKNIVYVDNSKLFTNNDFKETKTVKYTDFTDLGLKEAKTKVEEGSFYGVLFIPKNAKNKKAAELFINFMARPEVQSRLNENLGMLAPQINSKQEMDHFLEKGAEILQQAKGASQYYDRDSPKPIAIKGMEQIAIFLGNTSELSGVLDKLEALRLQSFPE